MRPARDVDFTELIPELTKWKASGKIIDPEEWIGGIGTFEHLIAYSRILWPDFVEHDDCVFLSFEPDSYAGFMAQTKGDKTSLEAVMNHRHILDLFCNANPKPPRQVILYVGRLLRDAWQAKLNRDFSDRRICVNFPKEHYEDHLRYEITFFQER